MNGRWRSLPLLALAVVAASASASEESVSTEHLELRLVPVAEDLEQPWGVAVLPGELYVVSERTGQIQIFYNGERQRVEGLPGVHVEGQGGLLDIAASPDYPDTGWIYFTYSSGSDDSTATALARGRLAGNRLINVEELFQQNRPSKPGPQAGSRLAWLPDNSLLMSLGDRGTPGRAQNTMDHAGSILRLGPQGLPPLDNPLLEEAGYLPRIFSWGHRHVLGLAADEHGDVWAVETRPSGNDELIRVRPGQNYGWPELTLSDELAGDDYLEALTKGTVFIDDNIIPPAYRFEEDVSPSGLAVIDSERYPGWDGNLLVGGLESGQLYRFEVNGDEVTDREELLDETLGPVREVRQGADGYVYVLIGGESGTLFRLEPDA